MRAQFVRGQDPKDSMNIGNKYVRVQKQILDIIQKLIKEYNLNSDVQMSEDSKKDESLLTYEFFGKKKPTYYGGKTPQFQYYISYWFLQKVYLVGYWDIKKQVVEDQQELKTIEEVYQLLKNILRKNES